MSYKMQVVYNIHKQNSSERKPFNLFSTGLKVDLQAYLQAYRPTSPAWSLRFIVAKLANYI